MLVPEVTGPYLEGIVLWGDGCKDNYKVDLYHQYEKKKQYVLQMDLWGAKEMIILSIEGISEIDFSNF